MTWQIQIQQKTLFKLAGKSNLTSITIILLLTKSEKLVSIWTDSCFIYISAVTHSFSLVTTRNFHLFGLCQLVSPSKVVVFFIIVNTHSKPPRHFQKIKKIDYFAQPPQNCFNNFTPKASRCRSFKPLERKAPIKLQTIQFKLMII